MDKKILIIFLILLIIVGGLYFVTQRQNNRLAILSNQSNPPSTTQESNQNLSTDQSGQTTINTDNQPAILEIPLSIDSPQDQAVVQNASLVVKGTTLPQAEVFINEYEVVADSQGSFQKTITLDEGENYIIVTSFDQNGNTGEKELTVTLATTE